MPGTKDTKDSKNKKFANMHYPGMKADPNEGLVQLDDAAQWRLAEQIEVIGLEAQQTLLRSSALIVGASPLGVRVVKKLMNLGFTRVGVFGEQNLSGAHELPPPETEALGVLGALSKWIKAQHPWAEFEPFSGQSIDRQLSDIVRGFRVVISSAQNAKEVLASAREYKASVFVADTHGRHGWCAMIPVGSLCENCFDLPPMDETKGYYYPVLDLVAANLSEMAASLIFQPETEAVMLTFNGHHVVNQKLKPKPGCKICR